MLAYRLKEKKNRKGSNGAAARRARRVEAYSSKWFIFLVLYGVIHISNKT
jgi:hypothetical protein